MIPDMDVSEHGGITLELCAGIVDKAGKTPREIAKMEILEECGYEVPLECVEEVQNLPGGVGTSGERIYLFYTEVTDQMKVNTGGGESKAFKHEYYRFCVNQACAKLLGF